MHYVRLESSYLGTTAALLEPLKYTAAIKHVSSELSDSRVETRLPGDMIEASTDQRRYRHK